MQDRVGGEEDLRDGQALVGGVVEGALEPLLGGGVERTRADVHEPAGQAGGPLASHRVALVGHGGGADLGGLKRLLDFLAVGQQADVVGEFVDAGADSADGEGDRDVHLAGVGLAGDGGDAVEAELCGDHLLQFLDLEVVAVKKGQEAGLRAGGALDAAKFQRRLAVLQFGKIQQEFVAPEGGALAHGGHLGRLEMRKAQARQVSVLACEL